MSSSASRIRKRGPAKAALFSSWSRMTWQVSWQRKHSMHLRNSCERSTSTCCIRWLPSASRGRGVNAGICAAFS